MYKAGLFEQVSLTYREKTGTMIERTLAPADEEYTGLNEYAGRTWTITQLYRRRK